jgi:hypothetical protein
LTQGQFGEKKNRKTREKIPNLVMPTASPTTIHANQTNDHTQNFVRALDEKKSISNSGRQKRRNSNVFREVSTKD